MSVDLMVCETDISNECAQQLVLGCDLNAVAFMYKICLSST